MLKKALAVLVATVLFFCTGCGFFFMKRDFNGSSLFTEKYEPRRTEESSVVVTSAPTIATTPSSEPTQEPTPSPSPTPEIIKGKVEVAKEYTKKVIVPAEYQDITGNYEYAPHKVVIPKVVDDGIAVNNLNDSMYAIGKKYIDLLENNQEEEWLINIRYMSTEKDGIIGIIVDERTGPMASEWWSEYSFFCYDSINNINIGEEDYYMALGLTKDALWQEVKTSPDFKQNEDFYTGASLIQAIVDDNNIYALIKTPDAFSETTLITVEK